MSPQTEQMTQDQEALHIASLLYGYIWESLTPDEHDELDNWVGESDENMYLFEELTDEKNIKKALDWLADTDGERMSKKLKGRIRFSDAGFKVRAIRYTRRYAVAASLILVIATTALYFYKTSSHQHTEKILAVSQPVAPVVPGTDKAILTLAGNHNIELNNSITGQLAVQGNSTITNDNGHLSYTASGTGANTGLQNTVTTPRGGTYSMTLSDGTKMWLNAASSVRFPPSFDDKERRVVINGEVYFEVAHSTLPGSDKKRPFIVELENRGIEVEVLGTHFNINSYTDEPLVKTTLLEGSIRITSGKEVKMVTPNQQAQIGDDQSIKLVETDVDEAVAWKNGDINMKHANIATLMREIGRWYDVSPVFLGNMPTTVDLGGDYKRIKSIEELLKSLNKTGIHATLEGRRLTVTP
ncbi:MAG: FecR domain-containing protein [Chitinophagaceae bacterium]